MGRIIGGGAVGAVIYFIWGMLAWMALPLHTPTISEFPDDAAIVDALNGQNLESGVYISPFMTADVDPSDPESPFMKRHQAGPIFSVYYQSAGSVPMNSGVLITGFIIDLLAATLAALLLSSMGGCGKNYWCRVGFVAALGVFVGLIGHLSYWNWMHFPLNYTFAFVVDNVVGWALAGLAIAALVKPSLPEIAPVSPAFEKPKEKPAAPVAPKVVEAPVRNDAITLLATLQREARFVDIVMEPLADYSDEQVGAAARDVLRDCGEVLDRLFKLEPVTSSEEGADVTIPEGDESSHYRISGNASESATSGVVVHPGWKAGQCELPKWTGQKHAALVVAPAELEVK